MFVPLLIGIGIYFIFFRGLPLSNEFVKEVSKISPGTSKAVLIMADGEPVVLDSPDDIEIIEKDGTKIKKAEKKLDYSEVKPEESTELLFNSLHIPAGAEYNLILSDGTKVFLNAMTEFKYPVKFNKKIREVELSGEAYFEVAENGVPFIVKTDQTNVEAIGTSFNINSYQNTEKVVTTLVEGKVKVSLTKEPFQKVILLPAEQAVHNLSDGSLDVNEVDVILYTAWKNGEFVFYDTRLEDIMITLTRWYSANVFYLNPSVKELRFGGSLNRYGDIDQILDIIRSTNKVRVEVKGTSILFSERL